MNLFIRKAIMLFIVLMGVALIYYPVWATEIENIIIDEDTFWDLAGSPYNITGEVHIEEGVILTINPSVVVNGGTIKVWGTLNAIGTTTSKVFINNVWIGPPQAPSNATINIQFAEITGSNTIYCEYGFSLTLADSRIQNTTGINVKLPGHDCYIERNVFINVGPIQTESRGSNIIYIRNNVFYQTNGWSAIHNSHNADSSEVIIEYNSFLDNDIIALSAGTGSHPVNITAINNYWNTTDTDVIDFMIYDRNDTLQCTAYIVYEPFLTEPDPNTPILDFNQPPTSNCGDDQVVHDEVTLNGTGSSDPDGSIVSYDWSLQHRTNSANDRTASGDNPTVYNLNPGFYDVYLTVTDDGGLVDVDNMLLGAAGQCPFSPFPDADEDGEPDSTDLCPDTPLGEDIDSDGCALLQFCTTIDTSFYHGRRICNRSDWKNNEPLIIKGDCMAVKQGKGLSDYQCVPR